MVAVILISAAFRFSTSHTTEEYTYEEVPPFSQEKYSKLRKWCLDKLLCEYTISAGVQKPTEALWGHLVISFLFFTFSFLFLTFCFLLRHFAFRLRFFVFIFYFPVFAFNVLIFTSLWCLSVLLFFYFSLFISKSFFILTYLFRFTFPSIDGLLLPKKTPPLKKIWSRVCRPPQEPILYEGTGRLYIGCVCGAESIFLSRVEGNISFSKKNFFEKVIIDAIKTNKKNLKNKWRVNIFVNIF